MKPASSAFRANLHVYRATTAREWSAVRKTGATERRKHGQGGQQIIEFGLIALLLIPLLLGTVVTGIGLVRSLQAQQVCRDLDSIYIHGGDFSTYSMQQLAQRLASGLNFQIGSSFTGNNAANTSNGGDGIVMVSQIMYVGNTSSASCTATSSGNCTNANSFVFTQRIRFGNGTLSSPNSLGDPTTSAISNSGALLNPVTDSGAKVPEPGQTNMRNLWQVSSGGRTPLADQQVVYVVEFFVQPSGLSLGSYAVNGVYARYFF